MALAKEHHPDLGGDSTHMAEITEAYEILIAELRPPGTELAVRPDSVSMVRWAASEQRRERRENSQRIVRELVRHQTSPLSQAARQRRWLAIVSGGLAALVGAARALRLDYVEGPEGSELLWLPTSVRLGVMLAFGGLAAAFGLLAWSASTRAAWIESALEDADDELNDKNSYLDLIEEIADESDLDSSWTRAELIHAVRQWSESFVDRHPWSQLHPARSLMGLRARAAPGTPLAALAQITGPVDFAKLVIVKGLENELLIERPTNRTGRPGYGYSLSIEAGPPGSEVG